MPTRVDMRMTPLPRPVLASRSRRLLVALCAALALPLAPTAASALVATGADVNPLVGTWGVYAGSQDGARPAWETAAGPRRELLAKVALRPRARWYGAWIPTDRVADIVRDDIRQQQGGDPDVLVPMAVFREYPDGEGRIDEALTLADRTAYRRWVDQTAAGIGSSRVLLVLEPDLPLALKGWRPAVRLGLVAYAAEVFSALPNTTVYLDAGAVDWLVDPRDAVSLLLRAGIQHTRGFAVGGTHYSATGANIRYGERIVAGLAQAGVRGRHFVVDTADNGRPFTGVQYRRTHPDGDFNNAEPCASSAQRRCVALGIPPTTDVADARWGLSEEVRELARRHVDAYTWYARPWLDPTKQHLDLERTLAIAAASPY